MQDFQEEIPKAIDKILALCIGKDGKRLADLFASKKTKKIKCDIIFCCRTYCFFTGNNGR